MRSATLALRKTVVVVILAAAAVFVSAAPASALDEPRVPENVGRYFATGLMPRLVDLFGAKAGAEVVFDSAAKVGGIHRVLSFTKAFLSGAKTDDPTQITNTWIATITAADGTVAGVATVWINPASDQPELADFSSGPALATALATAPKGTLLVRDDTHSAWFATDGTTLTPLVSGTSGVSVATTPVAYQRQFTLSAPVAADPGPNRGLIIAVVVLGIVVVLLATFVLLPDRRRRAQMTGVPAADGGIPESGPPVAEVAPALVPAAGIEPAVVKPATVKPAVVKSAVVNSPTAKPATVKPATVKPAAVKPAAVKPATVKPATVKLPAVKPAAVKPAAVKSPAVKPAAVKPAAVKPAAVKPAAVKPAAVKPAAVKPAAVNATTPKAPAAKRAPVNRKQDPPDPA
ncbi:hypothetical protein ACVXZ4_02765 [Lacisediminihabitans sp. FW035]